MIVEIDESKFGKRLYNRGHRIESVWILGMTEKTGQKRIRLFTFKDRSRHTLLDLIKKHVEQDTIIYTDCWCGYIGLDNNFTAHYTVNHSLHFVDTETGVHTNTAEGSWTGVKPQTPLRRRSKDKTPALSCQFHAF